MKIADDVLVSRLVHGFGYSPQGAGLVATKLASCAPVVQQAFEQWWTTGRLPDLMVEEYDVARLAKEHNMRPVAALLTLDWLLREPAKARASLGRGHDWIGHADSPSGSHSP